MTGVKGRPEEAYFGAVGGGFWGSLIGLRVAAENEQRFARIALGNGGLPTGDEELPRAFFLWRNFARFSPWFPIGTILQKATVTPLPASVVAAYDAPFPSSAYKSGARAFPLLVPTTPNDPASAANRAAWGIFRPNGTDTGIATTMSTIWSC